jgi:hypothetical protein
MQRGCAFVLSAILLVATTQITNAQVIYTFGTYSQNFDTLASTGSNVPWNDNATIPGWYANQTSYTTSNGTGNTAGLYSYGGGAINPPTDRALGAIPSNSTNPIVFAVQILNNTTSTFNTFSLAFVGEQWRNAGGGVVDSLNFDYLVTSATGNQIAASGYTADSNLNFTALHVMHPASALDGNDPANQTHLSDTLTGLSWGPGQYLWLRWTDNRLPSNPNNGLSIDDLSFSAAVPEPGVIASIGVLGLGVFAMRNLRSKKKEASEETEKTETASEDNPVVETPTVV